MAWRVRGIQRRRAQEIPLALSESLRNMELQHLREKCARMEKILKKRDEVFNRRVLGLKKGVNLYEEFWAEVAPETDKTKP